VEDLHAAAVANPSDASFRKELARAETCRREKKAAEKKAFGGVFDRIKNEDEKVKKKQDELAKAAEEAAAKAKAEADEAARVEAEAAAKAKAEADAAARREAEAAAAVAKAEALAAEVADGDASGTVEELATSADASSTEVQSCKPLVMSDASDPLAHLRTGDHVADTYLMPPPNFQSRITEKPAPIDYSVPSFLRQGRTKAKTKQKP